MASVASACALQLKRSICRLGVRAAAEEEHPSPGALGSSNSSFNRIDGLGHSSSLGQARGYRSSPLGALQPKISQSRSRSLHTSRPLAAPVANRPLSPHLPLKKPQLSATFSISHRIFGVALGAAIISIPLATKFSLMFDV